jgi:hypothetical protein
MENLNKVRFDNNNKKSRKQTISLQSYFHRLYFKTKIRKKCEIEFYNYSKYKHEDPFYTLLKVNKNGILLSDNIKKKLKELEKYQYPIHVVERLRQKFPFNKMNEYEINECIIEFKKYIALVIINRFSISRNQNDKVIVAMTNNIIDELWHTLILFSIEYHEFSIKIFGTYLHHSPNTKKTSISNDSVMKFYDGYKKYFGVLHPIWYYNLKEELKEDSFIIDKKENNSASCNNRDKQEEEDNYNNNNNINYKDLKIYQVLSFSCNNKKVTKYNILNYDIMIDKSSILDNIGNFGSIYSRYCHNCDADCGGGCGGGCGGCGCG